MRLRPASVLLALGLTAASAVVALPSPASAATDLLTPAGGVPRATITAPPTASRTSSRSDFESLGFGQGYAAAEDIDLRAGRHAGDRPRRALALLRPGRALHRPGHAQRDQPAEPTCCSRNLRDRKVVEALLDDPVRGPGERGPRDGRAATSPA